jgi:hypothetical protein
LVFTDDFLPVDVIEVEGQVGNLFFIYLRFQDQLASEFLLESREVVEEWRGGRRLGSWKDIVKWGFLVIVQQGKIEMERFDIFKGLPFELNRANGPKKTWTIDGYSFLLTRRVRFITRTFFY